MDEDSQEGSSEPLPCDFCTGEDAGLSASAFFMHNGPTGADVMSFPGHLNRNRWACRGRQTHRQA